jgi:hypothetical protein
MGRSMVRVPFTLQMGLFIPENFTIMIFRVKVFTSGLMIESMRVSGSRIKCMEEVKPHGQMGESMREHMLKIKKMAMGLLSGLTGGNMLDSGKRGNNMGREFIFRQREKRKRESGWTVKESDGLKKKINENDILLFLIIELILYIKYSFYTF